MRLFEPVGRRVEPTVAGQNLLPHLRRIDEAIAAGLGCGLLPRLVVADPESGAGLAVRSLSPRLHRRIGLVLRRDKVPDRALREAIAALRALAQPGSTSQTTHSRHSRSSSSRLVGTS